ncbi:protein bride of sevenless [Harmonia axyridis]|uniref:protein bride of sevenless n=1 Tax=Harmonia axyridis TaxID=115357 RepID=UPI001E2761F7|nr:protein bride of sevenless [Harmonia axyridis]
MLLVAFFIFAQIIVVPSKVIQHESDANLAVIFSTCNDTSKTDRRLDTTRWILDRLNVLGGLKPLNLTLQAYNACSQEDYTEVLFDVWRKSSSDAYLGAVVDAAVSTEVERLADDLKICLKQAVPDFGYLVKSAVHLLDVLGWTENVTAVFPDEKLLDDVFEFAKNKRICIRKYWMLKDNNSTYEYEDEGPLVVFGDNSQLTNFLTSNEHLQEVQMVIAPTDGLPLHDISENFYMILPSHIPLTDSVEKVNLIPINLIFELSRPILSYTEYLRTFLKIHCNETTPNLKCLQSKNIQFSNKNTWYTDEMILKMLKIEPLRNNFLFEVYKVENESEDFFKMGYNFKQPLTKMFTYNIFDDHLENLYDVDMTNVTPKICEDFNTCKSSCLNFGEMKQNINIIFDNPVEFRSEPFIMVFVAISAVGILVNLIILTFFLISICRREILEGNPTTTIFLLLSVLLMYTSVLPFSLRVQEDNSNILCLLKSLWTSLSICGAFSLILARCIFLATVTKEMAYMSHIPGSVQSFLTLFIFGVQAALSLQVFDDCQRVFAGSNFIYFMSYNVLLLVMIICLCPMIFKSQRNYREGKYFFISVFLIILCWCFWISCYKVLNDSWRDLLICFATISTASILQGVILVSRTYLMMVSSVRHKMRNSLPNVNERNGVLDIYRADARQVYDCVNVAAINAISVARAGITVTDLDDDIYNYPTLPRDEDLNFEVQTNSSMHLDKVTRF